MENDGPGPISREQLETAYREFYATKEKVVEYSGLKKFIGKIIFSRAKTKAKYSGLLLIKNGQDVVIPELVSLEHFNGLGDNY